MKTKSLFLAVGSILLLSSAAFAQRSSATISAYKTSNGTVWITGLTSQTSYDIKDVPANNTPGRANNTSNQDLHRRSNACGEIELPQAVRRFKSLSINGQTFNVSSLGTKTHQACNSPSRK